MEELCRLHDGGGIAAGVVVGDGDEVQAQEGGHVGDVWGGHLVVAAGGETGVDVEVVGEGHCCRGASFPA